MPRVIHCGKSPSTGSADCDISLKWTDCWKFLRMMRGIAPAAGRMPVASVPKVQQSLSWLNGHAFLNARTIQIRTQAPTKPAIRYPIHPAKVM